MGTQTTHGKATMPNFKLVAIVILILTAFTACEKPADPQKVVQVKSAQVEGRSIPKLVIRRIAPDGHVTVGNPGSPLEACISELRYSTCYVPLVLEGKAQIGDSFRVVFHIEDRLFESGHVQRVPVKVGVISLNNPVYEKKFSAPQEGENPPATK